VKDLCPEGRSQLEPKKEGKGKRRASLKAKKVIKEESSAS
jgi:hypothetical protein